MGGFAAVLQAVLSFCSAFPHPKISLKGNRNAQCDTISSQLPTGERSDRFVIPSLRMSLSSSSLLESLSEACSKSLQRPVTLQPSSGGGGSGGGGAQTMAVLDEISGNKYFVKTCRKTEMLRAEYLGVKEMAETETIRVPTPIAVGETPDGRTSFVVLEYLTMTSPSSGKDLARLMGRQLAQLHRHTSAKGFGFHIDNTIGATPQPNTPWMENWADFWDRNRLGHMLKLTDNCGLSSSEVDALRTKTRALLSHNPKSSLLHGDLWGGNKGYASFGESIHPVIFDPATYYGDREADLAMTELFGGFSSDFYQGYNEEWPIVHEGYKNRKVVYNLYHV